MSRQRDRQEHAGHTYEDQMLSDDYDPEYVEMKKVKEGNIRDKLKKRVEAYGGEIRAVSWLGRSNAPDVLCLFPAGGRYDEMTLSINCGQEMLHPWIETKRPGKDATAAQAREHERMRDAGCAVLVITNEQELDAWLPPL